PRDVVLCGEGDVACWGERRRSDVLFGEASREVVEPQRALDRPAVERPAVLRVEAEIVIEIRLRAERERTLSDLVRHTLVEAVTHRVERVVVFVEISVRAI